MSLQNHKTQIVTQRAFKLRKLSKRHGVTQSEIATSLGVSRVHLNMVLNSQRVSEPLLNRIETLIVPSQPSA